MPRPEITYDVEKDTWEVTDDFIYNGHGVNVFIPKGFKTDLASIPRVLWRIIAPFELSIAAPLVHDDIYRNGGVVFSQDGSKSVFTREQTDLLFLWIMEDEKVGWFKRKAAYRAVRMFAGYAWRGK